MEAWRENEHIDFDFFDAHDLYVARDTSKPETIKQRLSERMKNAKQFVLLGNTTAKRKGSNGTSFLAHEVKNMISQHLPVVIANLEGAGQLTVVSCQSRSWPPTITPCPFRSSLESSSMR